MPAMPQQGTRYSGDDRRAIDGYLSAKVETLEKSMEDVREQISKLDGKIDKLGDSFNTNADKLGDSFDAKLEKMAISFDDKLECKMNSMITSMEASLDEIAESMHSKFEEITYNGVNIVEDLDKKFTKWKWIAAVVFTIAGMVLGALGIEVYPLLRAFLG